jgi:hypothetical protein
MGGCRLLPCWATRGFLSPCVPNDINYNALALVVDTATPLITTNPGLILYLRIVTGVTVNRLMDRQQYGRHVRLVVRRADGTLSRIPFD